MSYYTLEDVFPACAGMFLVKWCCWGRLNGFPRVRGDVPASAGTVTDNSSFSPRARGCSPLSLASYHLQLVFPACAGMFLGSSAKKNAGESFPRVRGDVPRIILVGCVGFPFSPRARGCSVNSYKNPEKMPVFPACAGMFPWAQYCADTRKGFPRVRGDVPFTHTLRVPTPYVFPACAGMFLSSGFGGTRSWRFPRVRGDVPSSIICFLVVCEFSPRARGCSRPKLALHILRKVFPACAGMFPATPSHQTVS